MSSNLAHLTPRERQVAALVKEGLSDREIANTLHVAPRTAEWHIEQILTKLDMRSRTQLAAVVATEEAQGGWLSSLHTPHDLPLQMSAFVGREADLDQLAALLRASRLISLCGPAGVGKTRLALELASRSLGAFPGGVWFVDLTAIDDGTLVPRAVARALHVSEQPRQPLNRTLVDQIGGQRLMVLLDNCEHVVQDVAALCEMLLRSCKRVTLLATSRETLRVPGETVWRVAPLTAPAGRDRYAPDELAAVEAVHLFLDRARHVVPGLELTPENAAAIAELCSRLDGLPLGIELAAARIGMMSPVEMLDRLRGPSGLTGPGSRTAPPRHQSMQAAIDWSYRLLTTSDATLFRRLSVFLGTFTLASAEAVAGGDDLQGSVIDLLGSLVDKSFVVPARRTATETRYRLLDALRLYAAARLDESGEAPRIREAHMRHFLHVAEAAKNQVLRDRLDVLESMDAERDNIRAAFNEACRVDGDLALRLAVARFHYWSIRGHIVEGREVLAEALSLPSTDAKSRCLALALAAHFAWYANDWRAAIDFAQEAIAIGHRMAPSEGLAIGLWALGMMKVNRLALEEAADLFQQSVVAARDSGEDWTLVYPWSGIYTVRMIAGDYEPAEIVLEQYLAVFDERRWPYLHCIMRCIAALMEAVAGNRDAALLHLTIGLRLCRKWGANYWGGWAVRTAAYLAARSHDWERCWQLYGASQALRDYTHFVVRVGGQRADELLAPARAALDPATIEALIEAGESMSPAEAYDVAEAVIADVSC